MDSRDLQRNPTARYLPYHVSKENPSLTKDDMDKLQEIRDWVNSHFAKNVGFPDDMFDTLDKVKNKERDFDVHCKVTKVEKLSDGYHKIQLRDQSGVPFEMKIKAKDGWQLAKDDVVRIRSASVDTHGGKKLSLYLGQRSNIMKFLKTSKLSHKLLDEVSQDEKILKMMLCEEEKDILDSRKYISKVSEMYKDLHITNLIELFHGKKKGEKLVRAKFYILNVQPYDACEFVQGF
jgi:hypothetical protein